MPMAKEPRAWIQIGVDIERVERFRKEMPPSGHFFSTIFTKREIEYCVSKVDPPIHFAGTFAAKEAAHKAVNRLTTNRILITSFEVTHGKDGAPNVSYTGKDSETKKVDIKISVSHTTEDAIAIALATLPS
jgi:holo-[acyl-carrier protein] synthase